MKHHGLLAGVAISIVASASNFPMPAFAQRLPDGPSYPTGASRPRPAPSATRTPRPQGGGMILERHQPEPAQQQAPAASVELPSLDVQLANGWITQDQYDQIQREGLELSTRFEQHVSDSVRDAQREQAETVDRSIDAIGELIGGGASPQLEETIQRAGYGVAPGAIVEDPRRAAEAVVTIIENSIRTERNSGNIIRPGVQEYVAAVDHLAQRNIEFLRASGQAPADTMRQYEAEVNRLHNQTIARVDRLFYEHDRQVDNSNRIITEQREQIVQRITQRIEQVRNQYGPDPRNWPRAQGPSARPPARPAFSYTDVLTNPRPAPTSAPAPRPNPNNLPPLGGPDQNPPQIEPVPQIGSNPVPGGTTSPPRRQVRRGTIPPRDPYVGLRVPNQPENRPQQNTPRRQARNTPPPPVRLEPRNSRLPPPVTIERADVDPETGRNWTAETQPAQGVIDAILARLPRNRDGSIDWAHVPIAIRAQIILAQQRARQLVGRGGSGEGGSEEGGSGAGGGDIALLADMLDQMDRLSGAVPEATADERWRAMVADRFGNSAWDAFAANGTLTVLQLEDIYRDYDPLRAPPPASSLSAAGTSLSSVGWSPSAAGNSLSSVGWSLSSAGTDYRDPALESLHDAMGYFSYRRRTNPWASGYDLDPARAAQLAYNAGSFDVRYNRDGREHRESGGRLVASLFTLEQSYLRILTANGVGGLDALLAQPFNVILTWGEGAFDLDLHMTGPLGEGVNERFHIYFAAPGSLDAQPFAQLIRDCICNAGSEVILTSALNRGGVYRVSVFNFGDQSATSFNLSNLSNARIQIVRGGTTQAVGNGTTIIGGRIILNTLVPIGQPGNTWVAVELNPRNGRITVPNTVRQSPGSGGVG